MNQIDFIHPAQNQWALRSVRWATSSVPRPSIQVILSCWGKKKMEALLIRRRCVFLHFYPSCVKFRRSDGWKSHQHKRIGLSESVKNPENPVKSRWSKSNQSLVWLKSAAAKEQYYWCRRQLSQRSINLHFVCFIITPNELLLHVEFNLRIAVLPLGDGDEEHVRRRTHSFLPPPSARWSDPSKRLTASEQIERRRRHSDGSDSLFHFHAAADSICTDVQRIRWCMPLLSRSQLNELISAATKQSPLFVFPSVPARGDTAVAGFHTDRRYRPRAAITLWKWPRSFSWSCNSPSNSRALKKTRAGA